MTEDEMARQHHQFNGHAFKQSPGDGKGQGRLVCCSPWGHREADTTEATQQLWSKAQKLQSRHVVQSLSCVQLFETPWTAAHQSSLSFTISLSLLKLMSIESMASSNHLILCCPILFLLSIFANIRVFSHESALQVAKISELQLQHQFFQCIFRIDFLQD